MTNLPTALAPLRSGIAQATRAESDGQIIRSWLDGMGSDETRKNFGPTAERFLGHLAASGLTLRTATVEDVRHALGSLTEGQSRGTMRQYMARVKSLLSYAHKLGYTQFNAGVVLKARHDKAERTSSVAKRIMGEADVALLIRAAAKPRDRAIIVLAYGSGMRVSEICSLTWSQISARENGMAQISIRGKGDKPREILVSAAAVADLETLRNGADADEFVFRSMHCRSISRQSVHDIVKACAIRAGLDPNMSTHWLRHAHASHALSRGADLARVREDLGHADISTTSIYLHARPGTGSGLHLDANIMTNRKT